MAEFLYTADLYLFSLEFDQLIEIYEDFENSLYNSIISKGLQYIEDLGAQIEGNTFLINSRHYNFISIADRRVFKT
jgi:hypothetical protein